MIGKAEIWGNNLVVDGPDGNESKDDDGDIEVIPNWMGKDLLHDAQNQEYRRKYP